MLIRRAVAALYFLAVLITAGCNPIELTVGDEVEKPDTNPVTNVVVFIRSGVLFTTNTKGQDIKQLPFTDGGNGISLSYDKQKIAYITAAKKVKIISVEGELIDAPATYTNVIDIEWASNNETLFILRDGRKTIEQYGPTVTLPAIVFPIGISEIYSFSVSPLNDVAVSYYEGGFSGRYEVIHVVTANGDDYSGSNYDEVAFIQFPFGSGAFVSGYVESYGDYKEFEWYYKSSSSFYNSIEFYDSETPDYSVYKNSTERVLASPASGSGSSVDAINLFYEDGSGIKNITTYTTGMYPITFDWKD